MSNCKIKHAFDELLNSSVPAENVLDVFWYDLKNKTEYLYGKSYDELLKRNKDSVNLFFEDGRNIKLKELFNYSDNMEDIESVQSDIFNYAITFQRFKSFTKGRVGDFENTLLLNFTDHSIPPLNKNKIRQGLKDFFTIDFQSDKDTLQNILYFYNQFI